MRIARLFFFLASFAALAQNAPTYKVDPFWPKQLPNDWIIGQIGGLTVDRQNHIWVLQRPGSVRCGVCQAGNLRNAGRARSEICDPAGR